MKLLQQVISIDTIFFEVLGYGMSYIEFIGTLLGLASVWFASKANIFTWPTGLLNAIAFFVIFYQVQLYADMLLQVFFFSACIYGWFTWQNKEDINAEKISVLKLNQRIIWVLVVGLMIITLGYFNANIHEFFPSIFKQPAAYPYWDAFTTSFSIAAMILMAQRKIESWIFWILVDIVAIVLYFLKDIKFISLEFVIFLILSIIGFNEWQKHYKDNRELEISKSLVS